MTLELGQTVYIAWSSSRSRKTGISPAKVEKIGRKWVTLGGGYRFDKGDPARRLDGGDYSSPGKVFLTPAEYKDEVAIDRAWHNLTCQVRARIAAPRGVTADAIKQATALLDLEPLEGDNA